MTTEFLYIKIESVDDARKYIAMLAQKGLLYHLDDSVYDIDSFHDTLSGKDMSAMNKRAAEVDHYLGQSKHREYLMHVDPWTLY